MLLEVELPSEALTAGGPPVVHRGKGRRPARLTCSLTLVRDPTAGTPCCPSYMELLACAPSQNEVPPAGTVFRAVLRAACATAGFPLMDDSPLVCVRGKEEASPGASFTLPPGLDHTLTIIFPEVVTVSKAVYDVCRAAVADSEAKRKALQTAKQLPMHLQIVAADIGIASNLTDGFLVRC